jgi:Smg protein
MNPFQGELLVVSFSGREKNNSPLNDWTVLWDRRSAPLVVNQAPTVIYIGPEFDRLDAGWWGLSAVSGAGEILDLEVYGLVIDRVIALEADDVGLHQLK